MNRSINCEFEFNNVGQGLFYSAKLENHDFSFSFIYDCGTLSTRKYLNNQIEIFKYNLKENNKLDILIISHFDADHINGLDKLLDGISVDTAVIPYISPIERLIIATKFPNQHDGYYEFLSNPIGYLVQKGVGKVIVIGGDIPSNEIDLSNLPSDSNQMINVKLEDDKELRDRVLEDNGDIINFIQNVSFKNHNGYIIVKSLWVFRFFNYSVSTERLERFMKAIANEKVDLSTTEKIIDVLKDKTKRDKMPKYYSRLHPKINSTSLLTYHGPIKRINEVDGYIRPQCKHICNNDKRYRKFNSEIRCQNYLNLEYETDCMYESNIYGTILLGDINLNERFTEIIEHFNLSWDKILIASIPHHGSNENWCRNILEVINNFSFWVVSFGIYNRFKHPGRIVINDLVNCLPEKKLLLCNECFSIKGDIYVEY